eukprot:CCRYP_018122-RA/>CCRYP_018122-RA protein AED:0.40 eAED:0.40 QI:0/0/0/1/1/1/2/0/152
MTLTYGPLMLSDRKGRKYYSYILVYLDDLLVVHHNPKRIMDKINSFFPLKPDSAGAPEMYLSAKLKRKTFEDGTTAWALSPAKYVQQAVKNVTFLKNNLEGWFSLPKLIFDPKEPDVGKSDFVECDWSDFYPGMEEALPPNAPTPLGKDVVL